jgi:hypothetical protein
MKRAIWKPQNCFGGSSKMDSWEWEALSSGGTEGSKFRGELKKRTDSHLSVRVKVLGMSLSGTDISESLRLTDKQALETCTFDPFIL